MQVTAALEPGSVDDTCFQVMTRGQVSILQNYFIEARRKARKVLFP